MSGAGLYSFHADGERERGVLGLDPETVPHKLIIIPFLETKSL